MNKYMQTKEQLTTFTTFILNLAQSSLTEFQFKAFRKITLNYFADLLKSLGTDRCGQMQNDGKGGGVMGGS